MNTESNYTSLLQHQYKKIIPVGLPVSNIFKKGTLKIKKPNQFHVHINTFLISYCIWVPTLYIYTRINKYYSKSSTQI